MEEQMGHGYPDAVARFVKWFAWLYALAAIHAVAQVAVISGQVNYNGLPVPAAPIRVCSITSTGTPCVPTVNIYQDYALLNPFLSNPTAADQFGNFTIFVPALPAPNLYLVQITYSPIALPWQYVYEGPSLSASGGTINGNLIINGNLTVNGTDTAQIFNATVSPYYEVNGVQIACANLSDCANLAKLNAANTFTGSPQTAPIFNALTQYNVAGFQIAASNLANGTTGTGAIVLANAPALITPNIGAATGTSLSLTGIENAAGYKVGGSAGTSGQCLSSDGTSYDTPISCLTSATLFYQTVALNGTAQTQRPTLNFSSLFTATDSASPARTTIGLNSTGTEAKAVTAVSAGATGNCANWLSTGGIGDAGAACGTLGTSSANTNGYVIIPASPHNIYIEWGDQSSLGNNVATLVTLPLTFPNACLNARAVENETNTAARPGNPRTISAACASASTINVWANGSGSEAQWEAIGW